MDKLVANGQPIEIRENVVVTREPTTEDWIKEWLCTFNTDSATECFTAVQQLKEKLNGQMD
jgi:hypothetical protein